MTHDQYKMTETRDAVRRVYQLHGVEVTRLMLARVGVSKIVELTPAKAQELFEYCLPLIGSPAISPTVH